MQHISGDVNFQQRFLSLGADVGTALTCCESLEEMLNRCARALVKHLDLEFARIWVFNEPDKFLVLRASAGLHESLDGEHARIRLGETIVGIIAEKRLPQLTNQLVDDQVFDRNRADEQGPTSFIGHPLLVQDQLVGVIGLFARRTLDEETLHGLEPIAAGIAIGVHRNKIEMQLRERESLFNHFAENMRGVMWITSPGGLKHLYISPAYEHVFGRTVKELLENPLTFLDAVLPEDRPILLRMMGADDPHSKPATDVEYRIRRPDGEVRWLWTRAFPALDENGEVYQICGVTHDITEKKEVEKRVSEFYSMVSHELRTPLTSIRAALGLIEGGMTGVLSDDTSELISIARNESDRLIRLINDILDMRKMEAGKLQLVLLPLEPESVIVRTLSSLRSFAQENGVELVSVIGDEREFLGDDDRVVQVLTNLISNAIKFSPSGNDVIISVEPAENGRVRFSVIDRGPGIPPQQVHKLFGLFQQLDSSDSRARGGTGLGLAISKAIVERLGGAIGFRSEFGAGSTFWFELNPVAAQPSVEDKPLRDLLSEYARLLPLWLKSLSFLLDSARRTGSDFDLNQCLNNVRRIRGSAEPCGFEEVTECMVAIEQALMAVLADEGVAVDHWHSIDHALTQATNSRLAAGNNT